MAVCYAGSMSAAANGTGTTGSCQPSHLQVHCVLSQYRLSHCCHSQRWQQHLGKLGSSVFLARSLLLSFLGQEAEKHQRAAKLLLLCVWLLWPGAGQPPPLLLTVAFSTLERAMESLCFRLAVISLHASSASTAGFSSAGD